MFWKYAEISAPLQISYTGGKLYDTIRQLGDHEIISNNTIKSLRSRNLSKNHDYDRNLEINASTSTQNITSNGNIKTGSLDHIKDSEEEDHLHSQRVIQDTVTDKTLRSVSNNNRSPLETFAENANETDSQVALIDSTKVLSNSPAAFKDSRAILKDNSANLEPFTINTNAPFNVIKSDIQPTNIPIKFQSSTLKKHLDLMKVVS